MHANDDETDDPIFIDGATVEALLDPVSCFVAVRGAMIELSAGRSRQLLRSIIDLGPARAFGVMPGALGVGGYFGAKLVAVMPGGTLTGRTRHRGIVALFDPDGAPAAIVDAERITAIRTAAASAVATDCLARADAGTLALIGAGTQAARHAVAIAGVRPLHRITIWSRNANRAEELAASLAARLKIVVVASPTVTEAVDTADIICTLTGAADPVLISHDIRSGTHINCVGSSVASAAEIDVALVARARSFADSVEGVREQGGEWRRAIAAGLVDDDHLLGEIGQVLVGDIAGRTTSGQITIYKSLGHIVQDIAAAAHVYRQVAGIN